MQRSEAVPDQLKQTQHTRISGPAQRFALRSVLGRSIVDGMKTTLKARLRYSFDLFISKGTGSLILGLAAICLAGC